MSSDASDIHLLIHPDDLGRKNPDYDFLNFRDALIGVLSTILAAPAPLKGGTFTYRVARDKYEIKCFVPMEMKYADNFWGALGKYAPFIVAVNSPKSIIDAMHFFAQAMREKNVFYRFINLAMVCEVLAAGNAKGSAPACPKCNSAMSPCRQCGNSWKLPASLSSRLIKVLPADDLRSRLVSTRNATFHGRIDRHNQRSELFRLNVDLTVALRDYLLRELGLSVEGIPGLAVDSGEQLVTAKVDCPDPYVCRYPPLPRQFNRPAAPPEAY